MSYQHPSPKEITGDVVVLLEDFLETKVKFYKQIGPSRYKIPCKVRRQSSKSGNGALNSNKHLLPSPTSTGKCPQRIFQSASTSASKTAFTKTPRLTGLRRKIRKGWNRVKKIRSVVKPAQDLQFKKTRPVELTTIKTVASVKNVSEIQQGEDLSHDDQVAWNDDAELSLIDEVIREDWEVNIDLTNVSVPETQDVSSSFQLEHENFQPAPSVEVPQELLDCVGSAIKTWWEGYIQKTNFGFPSSEVDSVLSTPAFHNF